MSSRIRILVASAIVIGLMVPAMAIAADRFTDVPDTNVFHDDISWLADANITIGCNPPGNDQFCPEDEVTREQLAAFMRRFAAFLGAEDGVVTAVAGEAFTFTTDGKMTLAAGAVVPIVETNISTAAGYLMITSTATVTSFATGIATGTWVQLDNTTCAVDDSGDLVPVDSVPGTIVYSSAVDPKEENAHAGSAVVAVEAGDHTVTLCGASPPQGVTDVWSANVMALWTAEGSASMATPPETKTGSVND